MPFLVEGLREQRVEGRRDKDVEVPDAREVAQDRWHGRREFFEQRADARVNLLAPAPALEVAAHDLVQCVVTRAVVGGDAEAFGEPLRKYAHERHLAAGAIRYREQFRADDRDDALLPDVFE